MGAALSRMAPPLAAPPRLWISLPDGGREWALTVAEFARGEADGGFLFGSGLAVYLAWFSATVVGRTAGTFLHDPTAWDSIFAFTAVFVALLSSLCAVGETSYRGLPQELRLSVRKGFFPGRW